MSEATGTVTVLWTGEEILEIPELCSRTCLSADEGVPFAVQPVPGLVQWVG